MKDLDKLISKMLNKTIEVIHEGKPLTVIPTADAQNLIIQARRQANKEATAKAETGFSLQEQEIAKSLKRLNRLLDDYAK